MFYIFPGVADVVLSENRISKLIVWQCSLTFVVIFLPWYFLNFVENETTKIILLCTPLATYFVMAIFFFCFRSTKL